MILAPTRSVTVGRGFCRGDIHVALTRLHRYPSAAFTAAQLVTVETFCSA